MLQTSNSPCASQSRIPKTPMRQFLCRLELLRPKLALGKRSREPDHVSFKGDAFTPTTSDAELAALSSDCHLNPSAADDASQDEAQSLTRSPSSAHNGKSEERARLAFQLHDRPLDAIVVTTLPRYPFCRHEDLLTMSRQQLVEVATLFNAHLPGTIQIDCSDGVTASHIRHCIETLVGLIPNVPGAPKAIKSRPAGSQDPAVDVFSGDHNVDIIPSPPTSPLAMRLTRRQGLAHLSTSSGLLESLEEEDEEDLLARKRVLKKRKLSVAMKACTRSVYESDSMDITPIRPLRLSPKFGMSLSPDAWPQSQDIDMSSRSPPRAQAYARSKVSSLNRFKNDTRLGTNLKPPSLSGMTLYAKDCRDQDIVSRVVSELDSASFYSCLDINDDDQMEIS